MFDFGIYQNEKLLSKAKNLADGSIVFDPIAFSHQGTYKFQVKEIPGDIQGVVYDKTVYELTVEVTQKEGVLTAELVDPVDIVFRNEFIGTLREITMKKVWVNAPKVKPDIKVQLYRNGEAFGDPVILEDATTYTWKDLEVRDQDGKEYKYTVKELDVGKDYRVKYSEDGLTITNTYEKPKSGLPSTGAVSSLWIILAGIIIIGAGVLLYGRKKK